MIQKTCASGIWKIMTGRYDDGDDSTTTMCRRPDDDSSAARRRCADGTTTIDRGHDNGDMTTRPRRCDDGATTLPGFDMSHKPARRRIQTIWHVGVDAEPGFMTVTAPSSHRRGLVVRSSSCRRHAIGLSSLCRRRRQVVVMLSSCRRSDIPTPSSYMARAIVKNLPSWSSCFH